MKFIERSLHYLRCPVTGGKLIREGETLVGVSGGAKYPLDPSGIPMFAGEYCSEESRRQQEHYEKIFERYFDNLEYSHTDEYMKYLDSVLLEQVDPGRMGSVAEICCGRGEAFRILEKSIGEGVGVDITMSMLERGRRELPNEKFIFVQGDATSLPLGDNLFDSVFMIGGIHHVANRQKLFSEVFRILKPGGRFIWREPASDFLVWRLIRAVVYRLSPALDHKTERPLLYAETVPPLERAGFRIRQWKTCGFLGFSIFMNSDILIFNRLFRFVPGIRGIIRFFARLDEWLTSLPGMERSGLIVVGSAEKPV